MKILRKRRHFVYELPERIEVLIRDGLLNWMEKREYRNPYDSVVVFAESLGVTEGEVADYLRYHLDIKYCTLRRLLRIQDAAIMLLLLPDTPLRNIGRQVGYTDPSNFRKQFREYTRHNPDSWRKRIVEKRKAAIPSRDERQPVAPTLRVWLPIYRNK